MVVRYAPCNPVLMEGEALASAAANRSAAFYQTKQYQQAIEDIGGWHNRFSLEVYKTWGCIITRVRLLVGRLDGRSIIIT